MVLLRSKPRHQHSAAGSNFLLIEAVEGVFPVGAYFYQACLSQDGKMVRNRWLGDLQVTHDFIHRQPLATAELHDLLAGFVCQSFGETKRIRRFVLGNHCQVLYRYLSICQGHPLAF